MRSGPALAARGVTTDTVLGARPNDPFATVFHGILRAGRAPTRCTRLRDPDK